MPRGSRGPGGTPPIRRKNGTIVVELPRRARRFVVVTAEAVLQSADDPSSLGFGRLYRPIDGSAVFDDPLATLERQTAIDATCRAVIDSAQQKALSDAEAEAWLRMLGMAVAITAANAGVKTEDDLDRLDPKVSRFLDLLRSLQLLLVGGLDPTLPDPPAA